MFSLKKTMLGLRQLDVGFNFLMGGCEAGARLLSDEKQLIEVTAWEILVRSYRKIKEQKTSSHDVGQTVAEVPRRLRNVCS